MEHTNDEKFRKAIAPKSDQLNSDDLINGPITIRVLKINIRDSEQQPIDIFFEGDNGKPYKPCKSMGRVLGKCWGGPSTWIGKSMTLYRDEKVTWAGMEVGGIRISHMTDIPEKITMALTASKNNRKPYVINPLVVKNAPKQPQIDPEIIKAGDEAADKGVLAYVAWRDDLEPDVKETIRSRNAAWSDRAKKADAKALDTGSSI